MKMPWKLQERNQLVKQVSMRGKTLRAIHLVVEPVLHQHRANVLLELCNWYPKSEVSVQCNDTPQSSQVFLVQTIFHEIWKWYSSNIFISTNSVPIKSE